jgi:hypothetical protein
MLKKENKKGFDQIHLIASLQQYSVGPELLIKYFHITSLLREHQMSTW